MKEYDEKEKDEELQNEMDEEIDEVEEVRDFVIVGV